MLWKAKSHSKKGNIAEAMELYATILATFPNNKKAHQSLVVLSNANNSGASSDLPQDAMNQLLKFYNENQFEAVVRGAQSLIDFYPDSFFVWNILGVSALQLQNTGLAISAFKKVISINPNSPETYNNMGIALKNGGNVGGAIEAFNHALLLKPKYVEAYYNMGNALQDQGKLNEALKAYKAVLSIKPDYAAAYNTMGVVLKDQGKFEEAIEAYNKALNITPDDAVTYSNMGVALSDQGNLEEAIAAYIKSISLKPDYAEAYCNMGLALADQGKLEEAIEAYKEALLLKPDYPEVGHNMSLSLLADKNFSEGFKLSEWRWKTKERIGKFFQSSKPLWNGERNKRVLVWGEQGIGDEIMFASIIPELHEISSGVILQCDKRLIPLFERSFPDNIVYYSDIEAVAEDEYDFHIPIGSLPSIFRTSLASFRESSAGFLNYDREKADSLRDAILVGEEKKVIGISWRTKSPLRNASQRCIELADLAQTLGSANTQIVSLQYGDVDDEVKAVERDFGIKIMQIDEIDNMNDIDGLASLIMSCDEVVTTTNSTVHLAGALGANVKVLLPFSPGWIWGREGSDSYWYDTVLPHKQSNAGDWSDVLRCLK